MELPKPNVSGESDARLFALLRQFVGFFGIGRDERTVLMAIQEIEKRLDRAHALIVLLEDLCDEASTFIARETGNYDLAAKVGLKGREPDAKT